MKKNKIKNNSSKQFNVSNFNSEARDFPITRDELDFAYDFMKRHAPQDKKKKC